MAKVFRLKHKLNHATSYYFTFQSFSSSPENHIQLSHHIQFFTMSSKALDMLWPLPTSLSFPFMFFSLVTVFFPPWLLWDLSLMSQACSCHRAFASAIPSYWTLQDEIIQRLGLGSSVLFSERTSMTTHMHCWFSLLF